MSHVVLFLCTVLAAVSSFQGLRSHSIHATVGALLLVTRNRSRLVCVIGDLSGRNGCSRGQSAWLFARVPVCYFNHHSNAAGPSSRQRPPSDELLRAAARLHFRARARKLVRPGPHLVSPLADSNSAGSEPSKHPAAHSASRATSGTRLCCTPT